MPRHREGAGPGKEHSPNTPSTLLDNEASVYITPHARTVNSSRRAGPLARFIALLLLLFGSWGILIGLWQAVDHAPNVTIPFIIVGCILTVGRILWLEVRR